MEKVNFDPFLTIFGPFSSRAKIRENMAERAAGDRKPPLAVRVGHSEGWKPPKRGGFRWKKCPRNCDSGPLARDTSIFQFPPTGHARGPKRAIWGPTDTILGANGSKHGRKRTQTLLNCILSINNGNQTSHGAPWRHHGPFLAFLGHFWPQNFSKCPGGQNTSKSPIPAGGGPTEKKVVPEKVAEKHPR